MLVSGCQLWQSIPFTRKSKRGLRLGRLNIGRRKKLPFIAASSASARVGTPGRVARYASKWLAGSKEAAAHASKVTYQKNRKSPFNGLLRLGFISPLAVRLCKGELRCLFTSN
jgi:hypothetical protein